MWNMHAHPGKKGKVLPGKFRIYIVLQKSFSTTLKNSVLVGRILIFWSENAQENKAPSKGDLEYWIHHENATALPIEHPHVQVKSTQDHKRHFQPCTI